VVTAFQVCRLIAVLLLVAPMYRRLYPRIEALSAPRANTTLHGWRRPRRKAQQPEGCAAEAMRMGGTG
jgi:hypothetical protein